MAENVYLISVAKNNNNVRKSFRTETDWISNFKKSLLFFLVLITYYNKL